MPLCDNLNIRFLNSQQIKKNIPKTIIHLTSSLAHTPRHSSHQFIHTTIDFPHIIASSRRYRPTQPKSSRQRRKLQLIPSASKSIIGPKLELHDCCSRSAYFACRWAGLLQSLSRHAHSTFALLRRPVYIPSGGGFATDFGCWITTACSPALQWFFEGGVDPTEEPMRFKRNS